jgi:hypothetical protein
MYSGDETVLNITDITTPVEDYLEYSYNGTPFAISTENAYYLFLPDEKSNSVDNVTHCLKYDYTAKTWTHYEYPGIFFGYDMLSVDDIRVYVKLPQGVVGEFNIESEYKDLFDNVPETLPYGDLLTESDEGIAADVANWNGNTSFVTPIKFEVDTGQKSDNFTYTKQFCESKFIVATKHVKDTFPMSVVVHTDGNLRTHRIDVTTDAAFWKNSISHLGTLSTTFNSVFEDNLDTFRQMFLRYSGKGKSIRYIISGESLYKFKIYEIFSRYKNPNVKQ